MKIIRLLLHYLRDFVLANLAIAKQVLSPRLQPDPVTVVLDTKATKPLEILILSNMVTFTPGTLVLDFEPGENITIHLLNRDEKIAHHFREELERPLLEITRP